MSDASYQHLRAIGQEFGVQIYRPGITQLHFLVQNPMDLMQLCIRLRDENCYLVTLVGNDERELEDDCFKLYYIFSHAVDNVFLVVEYGLQPGREIYPSIFTIYPAVEPFEREMADLFGLLPEQQEPRVIPQAYLHSCYPAGLTPLRRDCTQASFQRLMAGSSAVMTLPPVLEGVQHSPPGELFVTLGPVQGDGFEPANFTFRVSGETIEGMGLLLGYKHKGIERLYQRNYDLCTGWKLAEHVAGDSSFAHNVAYSKAVEVMVSAAVPQEAHLLRAVLLELERMTNHIGDCALLAGDLALNHCAAEMAATRERMLALCSSLSGSRFLRGVNRPGGICLPGPLEAEKIRIETREIGKRFARLAQQLVERQDFRERTTGIGVLPRETAIELGVTGLAARASGVQRDFRLQHPFGPYAFPDVQALLAKPVTDLLNIQREVGHQEAAHRGVVGDCFSRVVQRIAEVQVSQQMVEIFLDHWTGREETQFCVPLFPERIANFEWGLGYVEGWRGDIVYFVMKDKFERIYRCKVRDPSTLNWPGLRAAVVSGSKGLDVEGAETALVDFPLINKSFNLSVSGNDL